MKYQTRNWRSILMLASALGAPASALAETVQVTANLTGEVTWHATNEYVLNGFIYVLGGSALTIEPGTVIRGKEGTGLNTSALFITQGAKIFANGTRAKPIIFTAEADDLTDPEDIPLVTRGLWGGVAIYGKSVLNTASDVAGNAASPKYDVFEGLPDTQINGQFVNRFGGNDDDDNSGVFRYVSIRYPGTVILPNKEINGLSLGAVGRGTKIENVEVFGAADDSVEFFGGTVNTKYLLSVFSDDDNFDIDQGYRGKNQFWFAIQSPDKKDSGGEWNGEPNGLAVGNAPIGNFEIYNATWIGAGTNTSGNRALQIREYAAPKVFNSIITEYAGPAVRIDVRAATHFTNGVAQIQDNLWWNFATNGVAVPLAEAGTTDTSDYGQLLFADASMNNQVADPMLRSISRTNEPAFQLDPRPLPGSPALTSARTAPNDGFYTPVSYKGAFDADDLWAADWTFASQVGLIQHRPSLFDTSSIIQVTTNLTGTNTWYRTNTYVLNGFIYLLSGGVLNIEPGTVIRGKEGTGLNTSALFITQGAKIFANGTAHSPIVFTAEADDLDDPNDIPLVTRGLWGGVAIYGKSVLNTASDVAGNAASPKYDVFEGLPDTQINGQFVNRFGGNDDDDNSGVFRYVSIRYPGTVILPNKEINGLSLGAVGRGTKIENVEVFGAADDSVEFFGGTVNTKYLLSVFSDDDNFDIDQGYRGKNQFWFAIQSPDKKDSGGEWNGEPNGLAVGNAPIGNFEIYNATWIGAGTNTSGNRALQIREYAAPKVFNSIITEYAGPAVRIDVRAATHFTNGVAQIKDNLWWNFATNGVAVPLAEAGTTDTSDYGQLLFADASMNNQVADPMLRSISRTNEPAFQLDPRPLPGSPALTSARTAPNDGFYTPVSYKGAFGEVNWAGDWTYIAELSYISGVGAGTPAPIVPSGGGPTISTQPTSQTIGAGGSAVLTVSADGDSLTYEWKLNGTALPGATNASYTIAIVDATTAGAYTVVVANASGSTTSAPAIVSAMNIALDAGIAGIQLAGPANQQYRIEYASSLAEPVAWTPLSTVTLTSSPMVFSDSTTPVSTQPQRFYRAIPLTN